MTIEDAVIASEAKQSMLRHNGQVDFFVAFAPRNDGWWLFAQPFRRALFRKRLRPLDVVLRGRHRFYRRIFALLGDRLFQRDRKALLDRLLGGADRHRRVLQMVLAQRSAATSASPAGTTSLTKPSSRPSLAETWRAVRIMPMARLSPICRGSRCTPPASAARPTRGSGSAKVAFSEAMIRSQASAISNPPPIATPLTAAMIGLSQSKREVSPAKPPLSVPRLPPAACHFRSLPAQNALSPAPVTMATHWSGSAEKSSNTLLSSKCASICSALNTSGRDRVIMVIGPLRVTSENFRSMFAPAVFCDEE